VEISNVEKSKESDEMLLFVIMLGLYGSLFTNAELFLPSLAPPPI
jgi:hypothetical protein